MSTFVVFFLNIFPHICVTFHLKQWEKNFSFMLETLNQFETRMILKDPREEKLLMYQFQTFLQEVLHHTIVTREALDRKTPLVPKNQEILQLNQDQAGV